MTPVAPGRWLYGLAILLFVGGIGGTLYFFVSRLRNLDDQLQTARMPGRTELQLQKAGTYTIFFESSPGSPTYPTDLELKLTRQGTEVPLSPVTGRYTYSIGSRSGVGILEFTITEPGSYVLEGGYEDGKGPQAVLTVGHGFMMYILITILGSFLLGFATAGTALVIGVVTFIKRYRASRPLPS